MILEATKRLMFEDIEQDIIKAMTGAGFIRNKNTIPFKRFNAYRVNPTMIYVTLSALSKKLFPKASKALKSAGLSFTGPEELYGGYYAFKVKG